MARTVTFTLPDGYDEATHLVAVVTPKPGSGRATYKEQREYAVLVLDGEGNEIEEIGVAGSLTALFTDTRKVIVNGPTVVPAAPSKEA